MIPDPEAADRFRTVIFDCDATLASIEGIEALAGEHHERVVALTEAAMNGEVPLEEVYGRRLDLVRPTRARVEALGREYIDALVPDARESVAALRAEGVAVRVISAGVLPAVLALGRELGLGSESVAAVPIYFKGQSDDGSSGDDVYAGYDRESPIASRGGKCAVIEGWKAEIQRPIMLVGDGANDLNARPVVDRFVAFAGVVARPAVIEAADDVIHARSLAPVVPIALGDRVPADPVAKELYEKGLRLLRWTDAPG